jgi:hypothetical protein
MNLATDVREELEGLVTVTVGGVTKKVTRQRALVMRLADNAMKGQMAAIAAALDLEQRLVAPARRREEERKQAERRADLSRLSVEELRIMQFLTEKAHGLTSDSRVVGAIAIYKEGCSPRSDTHQAVEGAESPSGETPRISSGPPETGPDET